jgi:hypothetical protein
VQVHWQAQLSIPNGTTEFTNGQGLDTALIDPGHFRVSIAIRSCSSLEIERKQFVVLQLFMNNLT